MARHIETRQTEVTMSRLDVLDGANPYDLIEDQLVPWRYAIYEEGLDVLLYDIEVLPDKPNETNHNVINVLVVAQVAPRA